MRFSEGQWGVLELSVSIGGTVRYSEGPWGSVESSGCSNRQWGSVRSNGVQ